MNGFDFSADAHHVAQGPANLVGLCQVSYVKAHPEERRKLGASSFDYSDMHQCRCVTLEKKWTGISSPRNAANIFRAAQANGAVGRYIDAATWAKPATAARLRAAGAFPDPDDLAKRISQILSDNPFQEAKKVYREALSQNEVWCSAKKVRHPGRTPTPNAVVLAS